MNKKFSSKLLLNKEDYSLIFDHKYSLFLPIFIVFLALFAAFSPLLKGVGILPIFLILLVVFLAFLAWLLLLNKKIALTLTKRFKDNELIAINTDFYDKYFVVTTAENTKEIEYKSIVKIKEYENLYLIFVKNISTPIAVSKDTALLKDGSDFTDFLKSKTKNKRVKKVKKNKQKAVIVVIVLAVFVISSLMPLIYLIAYNLFDYSRFGIR